jgi:DEAD_2
VQYNYLIDPQTRMGMKHIQWRNSVLIFDEAHNVEVTSTEPSWDYRSMVLLPVG